ncbi:MAG: sulfurtransferase TusA family protein [Alphaproteobacteria bacterium]|nr:sulfurtransferase TusA family protein [Alphaproteobacteria bacterium]
MTEPSRTPDAVLDTIGMLCPLPVLKARKALRSMAAGQVLKVEATDPGAVADFAAFCPAQGHTLLASDEAEGVYRFWIEKGAKP